MDQTLGAGDGAPRTAPAPAPERRLVVTWEDPMAAAQAGARLPGIDRVRAIADGTIPAPPMARLFGSDIDEVAAGRVVFPVTLAEPHCNPVATAGGRIVGAQDKLFAHGTATCILL